MTDRLEFERRELLQRTAGAAVAVGLGGLGTAGHAVARRTERPVTRSQAERHFEDHAGDLLAMLADEGLLDRGAVAELATTPSTSDAEGATYLAGRTADVPDEVVSTTRVAAGDLEVTVRPGTGHAYALLDLGDGWRVFDPETDGPFETTDCDCKCTSDQCGCKDVDGDDTSEQLFYEECDIDCDGSYEVRGCAESCPVGTC